MLDATTGRKVSHNGANVEGAIDLLLSAQRIKQDKGYLRGSMSVSGFGRLGAQRCALVLQAIDEWRAYGRAVEDYWTQCKAGTSSNDTDPRQPACRKLFATLEALQALL